MNLNFDEEIKRAKRKKMLHLTILWSSMILILVLLAYFLVHFCIRKTGTIGSAMEPTIYNGEEVYINTKAYLFLKPNREDVIAFYDENSQATIEEEPSLQFRRVIGLPKEKIQILDSKIFINGKEYKQSSDYDVISTGGIAEDGVVLGKDEYFVLCDARQNTDDSRMASFGNVKSKKIVGKVFLRDKPLSFVKGPLKRTNTEKNK